MSIYVYVIHISTDKYNCLCKYIIRLNLQNTHINIPSCAILNHFSLYVCEYLQNYFESTLNNLHGILAKY